jgi:hypothetical protein
MNRTIPFNSETSMRIRSPKKSEFRSHERDHLFDHPQWSHSGVCPLLASCVLKELQKEWHSLIRRRGIGVDHVSFQSHKLTPVLGSWACGIGGPAGPVEWPDGGPVPVSKSRRLAGLVQVKAMANGLDGAVGQCLDGHIGQDHARMAVRGLDCMG